MPKRRTEATAAGLLAPWTDADTAMQIVGSSLGMFGTGQLDADAVLSDETPLRHALFDVLLSLVEGGALEMRPADDGRYAFRWRDDIATAAVSPETEQAIDIEPPSPYLEELVRVRRERDDALGRADFAEALAAERERLLRLASVPVPATRVEPQPEPPPAAGLDPEGQRVLDVLYASRRVAQAPPDTPTADDARSEAPGASSNPPENPWAAPTPNEVTYLARDNHNDKHRADHDDDNDRPRWSGYTVDDPRPQLSTVHRFADEA